MNSFPPLSLAWFIYVRFLALLPILTGPRTPSLLTCFPFPLHPTAWILCQWRECRVTALLFVGFPRFNVISGCLGRRLGEGDRLTSPLILFRVSGLVAARCVMSSAADCPVKEDLALGQKSAHGPLLPLYHCNPSPWVSLIPCACGRKIKRKERVAWPHDFYHT